MCVVSKSSSWVLCPAAGRCMRPRGLRSSYVSASILWAARQKNNLMKLQVLAGRLFRWESLTPGNPDRCPAHRPYIALVSWEVPCLRTRPDAWLHGTDTAPSGSSPPPRRGRRILGVLTGTKTASQEPAAAGRAARATCICDDALFLLPLWPRWGWAWSPLPDTAAAPSHQWPLPSRAFCCCPSRTCRTRRWGWWGLVFTKQQQTNQVKANTLLCYFNVFQNTTSFFNWAKAIPLCWIYSLLY